MNHEYELEAMMEERDQLRAAVATSKSLNNFNCSTIIPTKLPIDAAGVSVTPGDATNPSVDVVGAFDVLARHASLCARNLASGLLAFPAGHFSFISSPHRFGVFEQHQQSMRQMQNGYPAAYKRAFRYDRVH